MERRKACECWWRVSDIGQKVWTVSYLSEICAWSCDFCLTVS